MARRRYHHVDQSQAGQLKELLNKFFRALRSAGFMARQNFSCCSSCAHAEISMGMKSSKKSYSGIVFYHQQDNDDVISGKGVWLAHSPAEDNASHSNRKAVGRRVVKIAKLNGLSVDWENEDPSQRIWVSVPSPAKQAKASN